MHILLAGATGLVGSLLAERLLREPEVRLHALVRRASGRTAPGWQEHVAPPDMWPDIIARLKPDKAVSALGTTMRAAGSHAALRAVDLDLVLSFAAAARQAGAGHMVVISSVGADPASRSFYLRTKSEAEQRLAAIGFNRLDLLRPGLLKGERGGKPRLAESLALLASPLGSLLLRGSLARYAAIDARIVAAAAAACLQQAAPGIHVHHNRQMHDLSASFRKV